MFYVYFMSIFMWTTVHVISLHVISLLLSTLSCIVLYERCYTNKVFIIFIIIILKLYLPKLCGKECKTIISNCVLMLVCLV